MRHAKSDRANWRGPDRHRPLNRRGRHAAADVAAFVAAVGEVPELVVSSPAVRAETTARILVEAWGTPLRLDDRLYGGGVADVLAVVAAHPVDRLLVVGHEPTCSTVVRRLTGGDVAMRTATLAGIDLEAGLRRGTLRYLLQPRLLETARRRGILEKAPRREP